MLCPIRYRKRPSHSRVSDFIPLPSSRNRARFPFPIRCAFVPIFAIILFFVLEEWIYRDSFLYISSLLCMKVAGCFSTKLYVLLLGVYSCFPIGRLFSPDSRRFSSTPPAALGEVALFPPFFFRINCAGKYSTRADHAIGVSLQSLPASYAGVFFIPLPGSSLSFSYQAARPAFPR